MRLRAAAWVNAVVSFIDLVSSVAFRPATRPGPRPGPLRADFDGARPGRGLISARTVPGARGDELKLGATLVGMATILCLAAVAGAASRSVHWVESAPPARSGATAVYDSVSDRVVVLGGTLGYDGRNALPSW